MQDYKSKDIIKLFSDKKPMQKQNFADLLTYWESLRADRLVPSRSDLDPREISDFIENTFILENTRSGQDRFRLAGVMICDLLGMELRGMPAHAIIDPECRQSFDEEIKRVLSKPEIIQFSLAARVYNDNLVTGRMILLPLNDGDGKRSRILGAIDVDGNAFRAPVRFAISAIQRTRIVSDQPAVPQLGLAEETAAFAHRRKPALGQNSSPSRPPRGKPFLRVVKGGKSED